MSEEKKTPPTAQHLADTLRSAGFEDLAVRAEACEFHDFLSDHATPELMLDAELVTLVKSSPTEALRAAAHSIRMRLWDGEFDASKEESDAWAESPEGQAAFQMLINKGKL